MYKKALADLTWESFQRVAEERNMLALVFFV